MGPKENLLFARFEKKLDDPDLSFCYSQGIIICLDLLLGILFHK
jgi:hypothetical protein